MSHPLQSPRVLTGESEDKFESLVMAFISHGQRGTTGSPEAQAEFARLGRELAGAYLNRVFWDRRKR